MLGFVSMGEETWESASEGDLEQGILGARAALEVGTVVGMCGGRNAMTTKSASFSGGMELVPHTPLTHRQTELLATPTTDE